MKNRPPVDIRVLLIVYNFFMVGLSAYMCYEVCVSRLWLQFDREAEPGVRTGTCLKQEQLLQMQKRHVCVSNCRWDRGRVVQFQKTRVGSSRRHKQLREDECFESKDGVED